MYFLIPYVVVGGLGILGVTTWMDQRDKEMKFLKSKNLNFLQEQVIAMIYASYFNMLEQSTI